MAEGVKVCPCNIISSPLRVLYTDMSRVNVCCLDSTARSNSCRRLKDTHWTRLDDDKVEEIMDEEQVFVTKLTSQVVAIERDMNSGADLESLFFTEVDQLIQIPNLRQWCLFLAALYRPLAEVRSTTFFPSIIC